MPIGMPNGTALANKHGFVKLNEKLMLGDVLYVLSLSCNLISIAQLIDDLCCSLTFTSKLCVIHDLTTKMLIGSSEHRTGVHFYKESPTIQLQANKVDSHDMWHQIMGHPSTQALSNLSSIILGINNIVVLRTYVMCV